MKKTQKILAVTLGLFCLSFANNSFAQLKVKGDYGKVVIGEWIYEECK
ncbi:MAG: hypothetical protein IJ759_02080 [Bacteroidales bacterium]|nr:hypothetical protein [Bacteroidales bacterium]